MRQAQGVHPRRDPANRCHGTTRVSSPPFSKWSRKRCLRETLPRLPILPQQPRPPTNWDASKPSKKPGTRFRFFPRSLLGVRRKQQRVDKGMLQKEWKVRLHYLLLEPRRLSLLRTMRNSCNPLALHTGPTQRSEPNCQPGILTLGSLPGHKSPVSTLHFPWAQATHQFQRSWFLRFWRGSSSILMILYQRIWTRPNSNSQLSPFPAPLSSPVF